MEARGAGAAGRGRSLARSPRRPGRERALPVRGERRRGGEGRGGGAGRGGSCRSNGSPGRGALRRHLIVPAGAAGGVGPSSAASPSAGPAPRSGRRRRRSRWAAGAARAAAGDARAERGWRFRRAGHGGGGPRPAREAAAAELVPRPRGGKVAGAGGLSGSARPDLPPGAGPSPGRPSAAGVWLASSGDWRGTNRGERGAGTPELGTPRPAAPVAYPPVWWHRR